MHPELRAAVPHSEKALLHKFIPAILQRKFIIVITRNQILFSNYQDFVTQSAVARLGQ